MYSEDEVRRRLYNAGDRISEVLHYSLAADKEMNTIAHYHIEAPEKDFFEIATVCYIGEARVPVQFIETILRADRYGERGVILVNPTWKHSLDADAAERMPVALTDDEAIAKGNRHWRGYLQKIAQQWIDQCQQVRAAGGVPMAASGFVVRALKLCGVIDPAQAVVITAQENKGELEKLREEMAELKKSLGKDTAPAEPPKPEAPVAPARGGRNQSATAARPGR